MSGESRKTLALLAGALALVVFGAALMFRSPRHAVPLAELAAPGAPAAAEAPAALEFVGSEACGGCHGPEAADWRESQHSRAMQPADDAHVLAATIGGPMRARRGHFSIQAIGPDGRLDSFAVRYTFGLDPLQQYLVELPGGRLQAFTTAWDVRARRWFELYPHEKLVPGDELHWTGRGQSWNYMCADCHSTDVQKRYDPGSRTYDTRFAEVAVGCESCHGPGSRHVAWMREERKGPSGLSAVLDERAGVHWTIDAATGIAVRSAPRKGDVEIEVCAQCHSRRSQIAEGYRAGAPFLDHYRPAFLVSPLYHADGQQDGEVYNWGSFLQSRMYAKGVTCSDCHEPHSGHLRAEGNALCAQCHAPERYDAASHYFHKPGTAGASCVDCHMPARTYMLIDPRRDHSLRIPRPDQTVALGVPNACDSCHHERGAKWAEEKIRGWHGRDPAGFQRFATAFHEDDLGKPGAVHGLAAIALDSTEPALVRASALARMSGAVDPSVIEAIERGAKDASALVRLATTELAADLPQQPRASVLLPLLQDPMLAVRIGAADALAELTDDQLSESQRAARTRASEEYVAAQRYAADRPEARTNLGTYYARRQQFDAAQAEFQAALALDPSYVPAYVNAADAFRAAGREDDALRLLEEARSRAPANADVEFALGLTQARRKDGERAIAALERAVKLGPDQARYTYTLAIALHSFERTPEALKLLESAAKKWPQNRSVLLARATMLRDAGQTDAARRAAADLLRAFPDDQDARTLRDELAPR
ncbi:MAG TPA: tetratricopeptide repeat protein [Myxococcota bacterium]|nr:tetratricopeptide repeat protein [Myxococcota bacterium]